MKISNVLHPKLILFTALALSVSFLPGCKKKGCTAENASNYDEKAKTDDGSCIYPDIATISFKFNHMAADADLEFDNRVHLQSTASSGNNVYSIENLEYIISDIILKSASGDITLEVAHYVDARDASTHLLNIDEIIPNGDYTGISFVFGMTKTKNESFEFTTQPEITMEWPEPMGGGWHYMKLEGKYDSLETGVIKNYNTHFGPSMMNDYSASIDLPGTALTVNNNHFEIEVEMDVLKWYSNPNNYDFNNFGQAIMGNTTAQQMLSENTEDVFSTGEISVIIE